MLMHTHLAVGISPVQVGVRDYKSGKSCRKMETPEEERRCINCRWRDGNICRVNRAYIHDADAYYFTCDKWGSQDMDEFDDYIRLMEIDRW